jgi:hypothetical protein
MPKRKVRPVTVSAPQKGPLKIKRRNFTLKAHISAILRKLNVKSDSKASSCRVGCPIGA